MSGEPFISTLNSVEPILTVPEGKYQVLRGDGVDHVDGRETLGLQRRNVDVHRNLALFSAVGPGDCRSGHVRQLVADQVGSEIE